MPRLIRTAIYGMGKSPELASLWKPAIPDLTGFGYTKLSLKVINPK